MWLLTLTQRSKRICTMNSIYTKDPKSLLIFVPQVNFFTTVGALTFVINLAFKRSARRTSLSVLLRGILIRSFVKRTCEVKINLFTYQPFVCIKKYYLLYLPSLNNLVPSGPVGDSLAEVKTISCRNIKF